MFLATLTICMAGAIPECVTLKARFETKAECELETSNFKSTVSKYNPHARFPHESCVPADGTPV